MKNPLSRIIPSNFNNLFGLAKRLIQSKNAAGRAAMLYSFLGIIMIPLDWFFQFLEKRLYQKASKPNLPLIFVCGPPRSGTTLVSQVLIKHLPVAYFNNLTSVFPKSPIIANKIFGRFTSRGNKDITFKSLYGRTTNLWAPNDALYLWDRWTGVAREEIPNEISKNNGIQMLNFFGAVEQFTKRPLVNKNNKLNTYANHVAEVIETAYFICLDRDPVYLAQSQLIASGFIHGDEKTPYGPRFDSLKKSKDFQNIDPVEQVCKQVILHKKAMQNQLRLIGPKRFIIVPYEDFCEDPAKWVIKIAGEVLNIIIDEDAIRQDLKPLKVSKSIKINKESFRRIEKTFNNLKIVK